MNQASGKGGERKQIPDGTRPPSTPTNQKNQTKQKKKRGDQKEDENPSEGGRGTSEVN